MLLNCSFYAYFTDYGYYFSYGRFSMDLRANTSKLA